MSNAIRISPPIKPLQRKKYNCFSLEISSFPQNLSVSSRETASLVKHSLVCSTKTHTLGNQIAKLTALTKDDPLPDHDPISVELEPFSNESHFDRVIAEAQQLEESVVVVWWIFDALWIIYLFLYSSFAESFSVEVSIFPIIDNSPSGLHFRRARL